MKYIKYSFLGLLSVITFVYAINWMVTHKTKSYLNDQSNQVEENKVGLLLGTRKILENGRENLYYRYRIQAAIDLYNKNKIEYILVSGDNGSKEYDEPTDMQTDLVAAGVPEEKIYLDYAGFRTLDSVIRSKEIFGQNKITIISQPFHNERAVFIARRKGIEAIGFNAQDVPEAYGMKTMLREKFARSKMVLDLVFNKSPKFLGQQIEIQ